MNAGIVGHAAEEALELYALGNIPEKGCAEIEEHLLVCGICQERLKVLDEYIQVVREAARSEDLNSAEAPRATHQISELRGMFR